MKKAKAVKRPKQTIDKSLEDTLFHIKSIQYDIRTVVKEFQSNLRFLNKLNTLMDEKQILQTFHAMHLMMNQIRNDLESIKRMNDPVLNEIKLLRCEIARALPINNELKKDSFLKVRELVELDESED